MTLCGIYSFLSSGLYPYTVKVSTGGSQNLAAEYGGVYTKIQQTVNGRPTWWREGLHHGSWISYFISYSSDTVWIVYNELEDGTRKIAMRSVDSILDELPYSGWEVEVGGTFVEDLQITLHGSNFFFFGVVQQLFSNIRHLPTPRLQPFCC